MSPYDLDTSSNDTALARMQQGLQTCKNKFSLNLKRAMRLHAAFQVRMTLTGMLLKATYSVFVSENHENGDLLVANPNHPQPLESDSESGSESESTLREA